MILDDLVQFGFIECLLPSLSEEEVAEQKREKSKETKKAETYYQLVDRPLCALSLLKILKKKRKRN